MNNCNNNFVYRYNLLKCWRPIKSHSIYTFWFHAYYRNAILLVSCWVLVWHHMTHLSWLILNCRDFSVAPVDIIKINHSLPWKHHLVSYQNHTQVNYAAADAIVALHIMRALVELKLARQDKRESLAGFSSSTTLSNLPGRLSLFCGGESIEQWLLREENQSCLLSMCQGIVEIPYKQGRNSSQVKV